MAITPDINYWAVIVAAVASMILGMIWYAPGVFGRAWMQASGKSEKDMKKEKQKGMSWRYVLALIGALVMSYVLAHFVDYTEAATIGGGLLAGFWIWLGFVATIMLSSVLWDGKPWKLYWINAGYQLISLLLMGAILSVWQ